MSAIENQKTIINILCKQHSGLNMVHFNARSLNDVKLNYVRYIFEASSVDIICASETWFSQGILDASVGLKNYTIYRNDRDNRKGGGVAIYCKNNLNAKILKKSSGPGVEFINVAISDHNTKVFLSCVYNPQRSRSLSPFLESVSNCAIDYDHYIVCGDINLNLLLKDNLANDFVHNINELGLNLANITVPTRFAHNVNPSLLDIIAVSDVSIILLYEQLSFISDHDLLFCSLDIKLLRNPISNFFSFRDYKSINYAALDNDLATID